MRFSALIKFELVCLLYPFSKASILSFLAGCSKVLFRETKFELKINFPCSSVPPNLLITYPAYSSAWSSKSLFENVFLTIGEK